MSDIDQVSRVRPKRPWLAEALVLLATGAALSVYWLAKRTDPVYSTIEEARFVANSALDRGRTGRVFVETPINHTGRAELDGVGDEIHRLFFQVLTERDAAQLVPRGSVQAIERFASAQLGSVGPRQRLPRANAKLNVMTVYSLVGDSIRISVTLERLVTGRRPRITVPKGRAGSLPLSLRFGGSGFLETWPVARVTAPLTRRDFAIRQTASRLASSLRSLRSCEVGYHRTYASTPWCWVPGNALDIVPGYFENGGIPPSDLTR